jgi:hypothetical protein
VHLVERPWFPINGKKFHPKQPCLRKSNGVENSQNWHNFEISLQRKPEVGKF